ncbi:MAG: hypothetical protein AMXMBFR7_32850 [Planctomycetota bacterium]
MFGHRAFSEAPFSALAGEPPQTLSGVGGIASAEAFGTPKLSRTVKPSGIASAESFGTPTLNPGAVTLQPTGIASAEAFGTPGLANLVKPTGIASAEAFGTPTLTPGAVTLQPGSIASAEAFGTPALANLVKPTGIPSAEAFGTPTLQPGTTTVQPSGIASAEAFGTPAIGRDLQTIQVGGIASAEAFGAHTISKLEAFVAEFSVEFVTSNRATIAWIGRAGYVAYIAVNGRVVAGPLAFGETTARSFELKLPELFALEIHEALPGAPPEAVEDPLERFPVIHWTRAEGAQRYRIYRKRNTAASEERIASLEHTDGRHYFEHRTYTSQRAHGGIWNVYRVAAVNGQGEESAAGEFHFHVPGLPKPPVGVNVSGPADNLVATLEV